MLTEKQKQFNDEFAKGLTFKHTVLKLTEEMAELTKELMKAMVGEGDKDNLDEIIAEIGDVELLLYQFKTMLNIHVEVEEAIDRKIERVKESCNTYSEVMNKRTI